MIRALFSLWAVAGAAFGGTIAHYKFEALAPDSPVYELKDSSGNGHHARVLGQELLELTSDVPPYPQARGAALDLRGRLDYAVIPHHRDFAPTGSWTMEFFLKPSLFHQEHGGATNLYGPFHERWNTNLSYTILARHNTNEATFFGHAWAFHYIPALGQVVFTISLGADRGKVYPIAGDLRDGRWHHVAVAFSVEGENEIRVFINGFMHQSENIGRQDFPWGTGPIYVGAYARQDANYLTEDRNFDGMIDELRFSDVALNAETFVVNFGPLLFPPIETEAFQAREIEFMAATNQIYRVEEMDPQTGGWVTIGYAAGEGRLKSFFFRTSFFWGAQYRVVLDVEGPAAAIPHTLHDAIEIRFPTKHGQLYQISRCETLTCERGDLDYVLGDGAKMSYFQRALVNSAGFYWVTRY